MVPYEFVMHIRTGSIDLLLLLAVVTVALCVVGRAFAQARDAVELTQVDLFSMPGWQQKAIAVDGFLIGMESAQASEVAKANKLRLEPQRHPARVGETPGTCLEGWCNVYQDGNLRNWIGIDLFFEADHLSKIKVSVPADADPDVKKVNVSHRFKGLTHQFFNSYSDALREKLLGRVEGKQTHDNIGGRPDLFFTHIEYDYPRSGLTIRETVSERDSEPFDLEIEFAARQ